jgi:DNA-binding NarL/FixJ family response regulator
VSGARKIRVLLADDHAIVLEGLRALVEGEPDMTVVGATTDGSRVPALVDESRPDVLVLDLELAGMRGTRVLEVLRARPVSPKVLVLTAYNDGESMRAALDAGADGLALKTESPQQTLAAIRQVAAGRLVFPEAAGRWLRSRAAVEGASPDALTPREQDVWELVAAGLSNQAIATRLRLSENTVKFHLQHLFTKLGVRNRTEAALKYARAAPP